MNLHQLMLSSAPIPKGPPARSFGTATLLLIVAQRYVAAGVTAGAVKD